MSIKANIDDIAAKLPQADFKTRKKRNEYYNQKMQSLRGGRQFILRTYIGYKGRVELLLIEQGDKTDQRLTIARRTAEQDDPESFVKALKSLERKAKCKLYYVLLISTDGEYL